MQKFFSKHLTEFVFLLLAILFHLRVVVDPDLGWHLRVGEYIWQHKAIPYKDLFSFVLPNYRYVYHSWLTELLIYGAYAKFGMWGVSWLYALIGAAGFWVLARTAQLRLKDKRYAAFLLLLIPLAVWIVQLRTQIVTFLGMALLYYLYALFKLERKRWQKRIWLVPLLFVLWANLHGGFILGLGFLLLLSLFAAWETLNSRLQFAAQQKIIAALLANFALAAVAALLNPYGIKAYLFAMRIATNIYNLQYGLDWAPLFDIKHPALAPAILLGGGLLYAILLLLLTAKQKVTGQDKLLAGLFFFLSLRTRRYVLPLLIVLLPPFIVWLETLLTQKLRKFRFPIQVAFAAAVAVILLASWGTLWKMREAYRSEQNYAAAASLVYPYPYQAINYLRSNGVPARMFNFLGWGGYLVWQLPERRFFIDGRMDNVYLADGRPITMDYMLLAEVGPGWRELLDKYKIGAVFGPPEWPIVQVLQVMPAWKVIYADKIAVILRRASAE